LHLGLKVQHNRQHPGHPPVPEHLALVANRAAEDGRSRADKEDRQANNPRDSNPVRHFSNRGLQVATSKDNRDREDKVATSSVHKDSKAAKDSSSNCCLSRRAALSEEQ